jgi:hypothetical protein
LCDLTLHRMRQAGLRRLGTRWPRHWLRSWLWLLRLLWNAERLEETA